MQVGGCDCGIMFTKQKEEPERQNAFVNATAGKSFELASRILIFANANDMRTKHGKNNE